MCGFILCSYFASDLSMKFKLSEADKVHAECAQSEGNDFLESKIFRSYIHVFILIVGTKLQ